jgi:hypothetical protein
MEMLERLRAAGNKEGMARTCENLGRLAIGDGKFEEAEKWRREAIVLYEELGDNEAAIKVRLASALADKAERDRRITANLEEVIRSTDAALDKPTRDQDPVEWATAIFTRGLAFQRMPAASEDNLKEAIRCYALALEVFTREQYAEEWARIMMERGEVYRESNTKEAIRSGPAA